MGISLQGSVKTGKTSEDARVLARLTSPRLAELVTRVNKHSNNFMAAQIARAMGAAAFEAPGDLHDFRSRELL